MKVYAVVFTDAYEGEGLIEALYFARPSAEAHVVELRRQRRLAGIPNPERYRVEEREVLAERNQTGPDA